MSKNHRADLAKGKHSLQKSTMGLMTDYRVTFNTRSNQAEKNED